MRSIPCLTHWLKLAGVIRRPDNWQFVCQGSHRRFLATPQDARQAPNEAMCKMPRTAMKSNGLPAAVPIGGARERPLLLRHIVGRSRGPSKDRIDSLCPGGFNSQPRNLLTASRIAHQQLPTPAEKDCKPRKVLLRGVQTCPYEASASPAAS